MMKINEEVSLETVVGKAASLLFSEYRFVTMTTVDCDEYFDIYYHFDKNYELYTLRLKVEKPGVVPSISKACFAALIIENEIQDLFGITFTGLVVDYEKHFLLAPDAPEKPFCHVPGVKITTVDSPAAKKDEVAK
ncbi:MAG: NADH-quinone oxidoreductase subunit C [Lentisphaeria bacterium]|nr:NADH-quinone oxidoreductase subunit C [Lentisphaeria bacterium]